MWLRSIPARAGQPQAADVAVHRGEVYPRACGATLFGRSTDIFLPGLSPRVRGNLWYIRGVGRLNGSIPARAGQPKSGSTATFTCTVYPRACGATGMGCTIAILVLGLSPRVRGNHVEDPSLRRCKRSIPARAGQPPRIPASGTFSRVYPRACGATYVRGCVDQRETGLSPRVRGNLVAAVVVTVAPGSIPARAGQPLTKQIKTLHLYLPGEYRRPSSPQTR